MTDQDRIKLAEAMGWKRGRVSTVNVMGKPISHQRWVDPQGQDRATLPDPRTNANDDYAVLEWMREQAPRKDGHGILYCPYLNELDGVPQYEYEVGDNARAALRVIDRLSQGESDAQS